MAKKVKTARCSKVNDRNSLYNAQEAIELAQKLAQ